MPPLSRKIKAETNRLIGSIQRKPANLVDIIAAAERHMHGLRYDARLAYLDGRLARSRVLNREADRLNKYIPKEIAA